MSATKDRSAGRHSLEARVEASLARDRRRLEAERQKLSRRLQGALDRHEEAWRREHERWLAYEATGRGVASWREASDEHDRLAGEVLSLGAALRRLREKQKALELPSELIRRLEVAERLDELRRRTAAR